MVAEESRKARKRYQAAREREREREKRNTERKKEIKGVGGGGGVLGERVERIVGEEETNRTNRKRGSGG